ncbi:Ubiquitin carboxyl-terminal hydrolase [Handroanthus impetiginosus]|uniref:ubiquitinyl hydrolase 1 n=1 Tax=Handroanthus impetiginosus TaxID=429701 RepID=A0A2G9I0V3_9LAMI|nr:Ubiquitin carboxyl-terminal hydrolase [Handroanthus impetiginosus]
MLQPRETDIPALFLVFVVLPLVSYFLLGKWSETARRKERISLIADEAAEESLLVNDMAVGSVMPVVHFPNSGIRQCARCFVPAATRCSQCKSVWYCSGRCQIVHWRHIHKLECQQLGKDCHRSSPKPIANEGSSRRVLYAETTEQCSYEYNVQQPSADIASSLDAFSPPLTTVVSPTTSGVTLSKSGNFVTNQRSAETSTLPKGNRDSSGRADRAVLRSSEELSGIGFTHPTFSQSLEEADLRKGDFTANIPSISENGDGDPRGRGTNADETQMDLIKGEYSSQKKIPCNDETKGSNCSSERTSTKRSNKSRHNSRSHGVEQYKSPKSRVKVSKEPSSDTNVKVQAANESRLIAMTDAIPLQENNRVANLGMKKSVTIDCRQHSEDIANRQKKVKMIFPYEEFVKYFQFEVFNVTPRGLVNCGNSCYANAVLQCLTCTKPLIIYLLHRSHSRSGCSKDWCLMCELEQLVMMLRESGGPLSPINILMYIRSLNSQIGDGSQEDAHEFLRLLVASMQSICLEGFGGENKVDPRLQDTTFIQHTFGGRLRSKVKCLRCNHESERYENMMDLTLEIFGWVESLEDALTQFTSTEDLDGENMYRCTRCGAYVRARKQLDIQDAPNILTIVLKRFQEGNYGKINKCITFPEMLDMVPFMTGTDDIPPLYMLYAVVVHLDTSNASFSGHYISYVKDLQGNWFRVDDTEVRPVALSQVMSEGAYILFYMRSHPRPVKSCNGKATRARTPSVPKHSSLKTQRSARPPQGKREPSSNHRPETNADHPNISRGIFIRENRSKPSTLNNYAEFSDTTSSDRSSLFTSSDDSSFTTESTRDSFSADIPFSSVFQSLYPVESTSRRTISCSVFPSSKPQTRFVCEEKGFVLLSDCR